MNCNCPLCKPAHIFTQILQPKPLRLYGKSPTSIILDEITPMNYRPANTHAEILVVVNAARMGERIEVARRTDRVETWADATSPEFNFMTFRYRVKPQPKKLYVVRSSAGRTIQTTTDKGIANVTARMVSGRTVTEYVEVAK